jgi:hypothetical protein
VDDGPGGATPGALSADEVPVVLAREGCARLQCSFERVLVLALLGGSFVTFGCLLSVLLSTGAEAEGLALLLAGLGFSAGYYFIALSGVVLFTEANVTLPDVVPRWRPAPPPAAVLGAGLRRELRRGHRPRQRVG